MGVSAMRVNVPGARAVVKGEVGRESTNNQAPSTRLRAEASAGQAREVASFKFRVPKEIQIPSSKRISNLRFNISEKPPEGGTTNGDGSAGTVWAGGRMQFGDTAD